MSVKCVLNCEEHFLSQMAPLSLLVHKMTPLSLLVHYFIHSLTRLRAAGHMKNQKGMLGRDDRTFSGNKSLIFLLCFKTYDVLDAIILLSCLFQVLLLFNISNILHHFYLESFFCDQSHWCFIGGAELCHKAGQHLAFTQHTFPGMKDGSREGGRKE